MKVGVTASREGPTAEQLAALTGWLEGFTHGELHHGLCIGGDERAHNAAKERGWRVVGHLGDTPGLRSTSCDDCDEVRPVKPNLARNRDIVCETDELIAMPKGPEELRSGTWSTIRFARKLGRSVTIFWPDGSIST